MSQYTFFPPLVQGAPHSQTTIAMALCAAADDPTRVTRRVQFREPSGHKHSSSFQAIQNALANLDDHGHPLHLNVPVTATPGTAVPINIPGSNDISVSTSRHHSGSPLPAAGASVLPLPHPESHPLHLTEEGLQVRVSQLFYNLLSCQVECNNDLFDSFRFRRDCWRKTNRILRSRITPTPKISNT